MYSSITIFKILINFCIAAPVLNNFVNFELSLREFKINRNLGKRPSTFCMIYVMCPEDSDSAHCLVKACSSRPIKSLVLKLLNDT